MGSIKAQDMIFEDACDGIQSVGLMDYPLDPWTSTKILVSVSDFPLQITKISGIYTAVVAFEQLRRLRLSRRRLAWCQLKTYLFSENHIRKKAIPL
jgi:hypothetical protein